MPVILGFKRAEATGWELKASLAHCVSKVKKKKNFANLVSNRRLASEYIKICFSLIKITQSKNRQRIRPSPKGSRETANRHRKRCTISLAITERNLNAHADLVSHQRDWTPGQTVLLRTHRALTLHMRQGNKNCTATAQHEVVRWTRRKLSTEAHTAYTVRKNEEWICI